MERWLLLLSLLGIILSGCAGPTENLATPLPTAVPPAALAEQGDWAISFSYEFPGDAWGVGPHRYQFFVQCPVITLQDVSTEWIYFDVVEEAQTTSDMIYLRLSGLSTGILTPTNFNPIPSNQKTTAVITFLGVSEHVAELAAGNCEALVRWDDKTPQLLTMGDVFIP
jgi:hypothetical protein